MLTIIPQKCFECNGVIPMELNYNNGLVQMDCKVKGFEPFSFETYLSWCSQKCFLAWYNRNFKEKSNG